MKNAKKFYWRLCYISATLLSILTFTPLIIPPGIYTPTVAGIPRTLWSGILITIALVLLTFIGGRVFLENETERKK